MGNVCAMCENRDDMELEKVGELKKQTKPVLLKQEVEFPPDGEIDSTKAKRVSGMNELSSKVKITEEKLFKFNFDDSRLAYIDIKGESHLSLDDFKGPFKYFKDESTYNGHVLNGHREGLGISITKRGDIYKGSWIDDMPDGYGRYIQSNGDYYEGEFKSGYPHGKGKIEQVETGVVYEGEFRRGMKHGKGVELHPDGTAYDGEWIFEIKFSRFFEFSENFDIF